MTKHKLRGPDGRFIKLVQIETPTQPKSKKTKAKIVNKEEKKIYHDIVILDASESMRGREIIVYEGYDNHIASLKEKAEKLNLEVLHSLYIFSDKNHGTMFLYKKDKLSSIKDLKKLKYTPWSSTPLYRSFEHVINTFLNDKEIGSITGITDGANNENYNNPKNAVRWAKEKGWIVALIGPKGKSLEDAIHFLGIEESNSLEIENSSEGIKQAFRGYSNAVTDTLTTYAATGEIKKVGFFQKKK